MTFRTSRLDADIYIRKRLVFEHQALIDPMLTPKHDGHGRIARPSRRHDRGTANWRTN